MMRSNRSERFDVEELRRVDGDDATIMTLRRRPRRAALWTVQAALVATASALAAGCGVSGAQTVHTTVTVTVTGPATSTSSSTGTTTMPECATRNLAVRVRSAGAAAGSAYYSLLFSNTSRRSCTLVGWPGVSAYAGEQVGRAAARAPGTERTVAIRPGAAARAVLQVVDVANFPASHCDRVSVGTLRVYPPDNTAPIDVPTRLQACFLRDETFMFVRPVE
jgi:hypothetical protein